MSAPARLKAASTAVVVFSSAMVAMAQDQEFAGFKTGTELIRASDWDDRWPFSISQGDLTCIQFGGQRFVFFGEVDAFSGGILASKETRDVAVSTNPFALFATYENRDLYLPFDTLETLIKRLGPIEAHGTTLCDKGSGDPAN